jgi:transposase
VAGLDVHKSQITYCILDRKGRETATGRIRADREGLASFLAEHVGRKTFHFSFEASGYSMWVHDWLVDAQGADRVHVAHAAHVRAIANSDRKNDDNDAYWLAYLTHDGRLPEAHFPDHELRELRLATRYRVRLVRQRSRVIKQIRSLLAQVGIQIRGAFDSGRAQDHLGTLLRGGDLSPARAACLEDSLAHVAALDALVAKWEETIDELASAHTAIAALRAEIPGFGRTLAPVIYAETGDPRRFGSAKQLGGFTGLTPRDRSSAGKTRHGQMTRAGSPFLRWALVQAVLACQKSRRGPGFVIGTWVRRHQKRLGDKKRAQCAAARKLAEAMYRLFEYGECFDVARAFGG